LFGANPSVTRIVVDLKTAQPFQVFPSGNTVLVKIGVGHGTAEGGTQVSPASAVPAVGSAEDSVIGTVVSGNPQVRPLAARSSSQSANSRAIAKISGVSFQNGLLRVKVQNATLAQVLFEVQQQTGAEIGVPAGAGQEHIAVDLGPGSPKEVVAALLNGSPYNFIIMGSERAAGSLGRVILTPKTGPADQPFIAPDESASQAPEGAEPEPEPQAAMPPPEMPPDNPAQVDPQPNNE
jgi:hypothetical protein